MFRTCRLCPVALLLPLLACRPVLTIGWTELLVLVVIVLILAAPTLLRFYRWYKRFKDDDSI